MNRWEVDAHVEGVVKKIHEDYKKEIKVLEDKLDARIYRVNYRQFLLDAQKAGCNVESYIIEEVEHMKSELA